MSGCRTAEAVVVGPAPPMRGGIAAHTARLVEHCRAQGVAARALSYRRLYPALLFPGRAQRVAGPTPSWADERLVAWSPVPAWSEGEALARTAATVVVQWWHPVAAPALMALLAHLPRERVVAVCHNVLPHESFPAALPLARAVLGRCGRVVCHSASEAARVRALLGRQAPEPQVVNLPPLVAAADLGAGAGRRPSGFEWQPGGPLFLAAGHRRAYKGTALLVEAWQAARRPAGAVLALVGESYLRGAARRRVRRLLAEDPSIFVLDRYVEDSELVSWLTSAHTVLAPYRSASQSGIVALAGSLGVPTIVSDAGGLREQAGSAGLVVGAGDRMALTRALERRFAQSASAGCAPHDPGLATLTRAATASWQHVVEAIGVGSRPSAV